MTAGDGHCVQGCPAGSILCRNVPGQKIPPKHTWTSSYIWVWILRIAAKSLLCWGLISLSRQAPSSSGFKPELLLSLGSALSLSIQPPLSSFYFFVHDSAVNILSKLYGTLCFFLWSPEALLGIPPTALKAPAHLCKAGGNPFADLLHGGTNPARHELVSSTDSNPGDHVQPAQTCIHF